MLTPGVLARECCRGQTRRCGWRATSIRCGGEQTHDKIDLHFSTSRASKRANGTIMMRHRNTSAIRRCPDHRQGKEALGAAWPSSTLRPQAVFVSLGPGQARRRKPSNDMLRLWRWFDLLAHPPRKVPSAGLRRPLRPSKKPTPSCSSIKLWQLDRDIPLCREEGEA